LSGEVAEYWMPRSSRGMTAEKTQDSILAARCARVMHRREALENGGRRECRVFVAPAASRTKVESTRVVTTGTPKQSGTPCAMVLRLIPCSPWSAGLDSLHHRRISPAGLTPASGDQDHTALPSVPISPAWRYRHVHRILLQRLWRLAKRPSRPKQDARIEPHISEKRKTNIFAVRAGHVGQISDPPRTWRILPFPLKA
jgi:hypothetical protein